MAATSPADNLLVITSASGHQATHLLHFLPSSLRLRLIVNSALSLTRLRQTYPNAEVLIGDLSSRSFCKEVVRDATALYHIGPPFHPAETAMGLNLVAAATFERRSCGDRFRHFIYSSVIHPMIRKMLNHDCKRHVEEALIESGIPFTIIQPTHFMDMVPVAKMAKGEGDEVVFPAKWDPTVEFSFVALKDLGEIGAKIVDEGEKHDFATYEICGTAPTSYEEVCKIIGEAIGKKVVVEQAGYEEAVSGFLEMLYGDEVDSYTRDATERMLLYYNRRGLKGNPNVMTWLLGRKPMGIAEWTKEQVGK
ncbi:hypothetical protein MMC30_005420 [Trapelia coarctata]|nr:hypothetical protein [Trapelia coarctata]